jgi:hypothetical protein
MVVVLMARVAATAKRKRLILVYGGKARSFLPIPYLTILLLHLVSPSGKGTSNNTRQLSSHLLHPVLLCFFFSDPAGISTLGAEKSSG